MPVPKGSRIHSIEDLSGLRFTRLVVLRRHTDNSKHHKAQWLCRCDCGNERLAVSQSLKEGVAQSCGGLRRENACTHGLSKVNNKTYRTWGQIKQRCGNPNCAGAELYQSRGVIICARWKESFENFLADMGEAPSPSHSIDRIDNSGNYEPGNCRWATPVEQANNRSDNRPITFRRRTQTLSAWSRELGIKRPTLDNRIRTGWSVERAFTTPSGGAR